MFKKTHLHSLLSPQSTNLCNIMRFHILQRVSLFLPGPNPVSNASSKSYNEKVNRGGCHCMEQIRKKSHTFQELQQIRLENKEVIARVLGIEATHITRVPYRKVEEDKAKRTLEKLKKFGISLGSAHLYPELLLVPPAAAENYIRIMQETKFTEIKEDFILKFRKVVKQPMSQLQKKAIIPSIQDVVESFCYELEQGFTFRTNFMKRLPGDTNRVSLFDLRREFIVFYFIKLGLGNNEEIMYSFNMYPRVNYRCLNWIKRNYRLLKNMGFANEKIMKHSYILHTDPENLARVSRIPSLGGMEMRMLSQLRPKILTSTYETLIDIQNAFIEHSIPFEAVQKYPELFTLSAVTIRKRLEEIESTPEFRLLKIHPRIGRLLYYQSKAKERLQQFRDMQVIVPSINMLSQDKNRFNKAKSSGDFKLRGTDTMICLSQLLQVPREQVRESVIRHPHWMHVPIVTMKEGLFYLKTFDAFSLDQLVDAIPLMLYAKDKIERGINSVLSSGEAKLTDPYFLQMVLYFVERETHFTGDGVWPDKIIRHEDSETDLEGHQGDESQRYNETRKLH